MKEKGKRSERRGGKRKDDEKSDIGGRKMVRIARLEKDGGEKYEARESCKRKRERKKDKDKEEGEEEIEGGRESKGEQRTA